jgi:hypothetical protein
MDVRDSIFQRHPNKTRFFVVATAILLIDPTAGAVRKHLHERVVAAEKTYRIKSDLYDHGLAPNRVVNAAWGSHRYVLVTNSLGFKDFTTREVPMTVPDYRIVFIGDSFTEGIGFAYADTYVGLVAAGLKDRKIDVLNAAVASYSPKLYLAKVRYLIEDVGLRFNELIVSLDMSDPSDDIAYHRIGKYYTDRPPAPKSSVQQVKDFISENTVLTHFVLKTAKDIVEPPRETEHWRSRWTDERGYLNHHTLGLELNSRNMDELAALLSRHGIRLTVAVYPHPRQVKAGRLDSPAVTHWQQWASRHNAGFVDVFPRFIDGRDWREVVDAYYIPGDIHVNEKGHQVFARAFLDYIRSRH